MNGMSNRDSYGSRNVEISGRRFWIKRRQKILLLGILLIYAFVSYSIIRRLPEASLELKAELGESFRSFTSNTAGVFDKKEGIEDKDMDDLISNPALVSDSTIKLAVEVMDERFWSNRLDIVHVMYTRFMQHQPNLLVLGKARLELFKTFCLSTIAHQTNKQFLWIIRTDPDLHSTLKEGLIQALVEQNITNVVVVGSNKVRKGSVNGGFRGSEGISDITYDSLFHGSMKLVQSYHMAAQNHSVIETNLDADDGLGLNFVESVQNKTNIKFTRFGGKGKIGWINFCVEHHLEWQYYAPWNSENDKGSLRLGNKHICITPGLSWATQLNAKPDFTVSHQLIKKETPDCPKHQQRKVLGCWESVPTKQHSDYMAIRARTPTSTGMNNVMISEKVEWKKDQMHFDKKNWFALEQFFGIHTTAVQQSHKYLGDNLKALIEENLKGQCTKDHSCSEGIKKKLKTMLYQKDEYSNRHGIVHVIETSLESLLAFYILIDFCFQSMEAQTTYDFLWIIRVMDFPDSDSAAEMLVKTVARKSPLNIIVVKSDQTASMSFRDLQSIGDITPETILHGDMKMLKTYHEASQDRKLLETNLEPTEALIKTFVEELQKSTIFQLKESQVQDDSNVWYYRCGSEYIEWNYFAPTGFDTDHGFLNMITQKPSCMSNPAVTRVSLPGAKIPYFHEEKVIPECQVIVVMRIQGGCYAPMATNATLASRVLVPESVVKPELPELAVSDLEHLEEHDNYLRSVVRDMFNILPSSRARMKANIQKAQCETCKPQWNSDHGVVHVLHTSLQDEKLFNVWRSICFTLKQQTTKKFLWIIRVASDANLIEKVLAPLNNMQLNVIVAKSERLPSMDFRKPESISDINNDTLVFGEMKMLEHFRQSAQFRPLLETVLEPTDALKKTFSEDLQTSTSEEFKKDHRHGQDAWYYRCLSEYIEWSYFNPLGEETVNGNGFVRLVHSRDCTERPGTTRVSFPDSEISQNGRSMPNGKECLSNAMEKGCFVAMDIVGNYAARVSIPESMEKPTIDNLNQSEYSRLDEENESLMGTLREKLGIYPIALKTMRLQMKFGTERSVMTSWQNDYNIVHVINSRFMQQQPSLLKLGKARLEIFKALSLPTLAHQSNKQFLWIIRTDPDLDLQLKENLVESLKEIPNVILVASDLSIDGLYDGSFRNDDTIHEFTTESILFGDLHLVKSFHEAAKNHTLLETNLDTDDGIAVTFVENVQRITVQAFENDEKKTGWVQLCLGRHLEWHFYAPWEKRSDKGCLLVGSRRTCVKSGMSWATQPNAKPSFDTNLGLLKEDVPRCLYNRTLEERLTQGCWETVPQDNPITDVMAIRAMSPASSGVAKGEISKFDWNIRVLTFDKFAWSLLDPYFTILPESIKSARTHLIENLHEVSSDNARSKCTHEKTCIGLWKNQHRVVHVIHSSINDPNLADLLHRISLSSLTRQTQYDFLWLIRVTDFTDKRLIQALLKPIRKSSFIDNIVLVKSELVPNMDFRVPEAIADISEDKILLGDIKLVNDYHAASQNHPVLETFLRPNEGVTRSFVDDIQRTIVEEIKENVIQSNESTWYYRCVPEYMERNYITPRGDEISGGFLLLVDQRFSKCMERPGVTRISLPGAKFAKSTLMSDAEECPQGSFNHGCFIQMVSENPPALRMLLPDEVVRSPFFSDEELHLIENKQKNFFLQLRLLYSVFPPDIKTMRQIMTENARQMVHVIHTVLHEAPHINTWRQMTTNSVVAQTTQKFLWIIRADYWDNTRIKLVSNPLNFYFKDKANIIFVSSNITTPVDFRLPEAIADITNETIQRGDIELLHNYHMAAKSRTVLETFLQPTDAIAKTFSAVLQSATEIELMEQKMRLVQLKENDVPNEQKNSWYYRCVTEFVEWNYFTPQGKESKTGFRKHIGEANKECVKDLAVTRISLPASQLPDNGKTLVLDKECPSKDKQDLKNGCFVNTFSDNALAARAILPESIEEPPNVPIQTDLKRLDIEDKKLSGFLSDSFDIFPFTLDVLRTNIQEDKCGDWNACTKRWDSEFKVVHVIQTSLQDPLLFDIWRKFTFSLEGQTTTKFLWIIRVLPSNTKLMKLVLRPIHKTPLNIVVVESNYTPTVDFRQQGAISDITDKSIKHGDMTMLKHFHQRAQEWPLLETVLEPNEALAKTFSKEMQNYTAHTHGLASWHFRCPSEYFEWNYYTPRGDNIKSGFLKIVDGKTTNRCIDRPGTTRISISGSKISDEEQLNIVNDCSTKLETGCFVFMEKGKTVSARLIIPESLVVNQTRLPRIKEDDWKTQRSTSTKLEKHLKEQFGVYPVLLKQIRKYIQTMFEEKQEGRKINSEADPNPRAL